MNIDNILKEDKKIIEIELENLLNLNLKFGNIILKSSKYSVFAGGKRLRPALFIEMLKEFNIDYRKYLKVPAAIELIHTYSLIHDDLPCMDNDDLRRGKLTNHKVFGEDIAVLTGDFLLNYAYEILMDFLLENFEIENLKAVNLISKFAGLKGMIVGQVSDVENENKNISLENLEFIHKNKTSKLIMASILSAALIAKVSDEEFENLKIYSESIGMAFQIRDDILDLIGDEEKLGKTKGKDVYQGKNTYPKYYGVEKSCKILDYYLEKGKEALKKVNIKENNNFFVEFLYYLENRKF